MDGRSVNAIWQLVDGNFRMEMLDHVTSSFVCWLNSPVRADIRTSRVALTVGPHHCGHNLAIVETPTGTELHCINSTPLVSVTEAPDTPRRRLQPHVAARNGVRVTLPLKHSGSVQVWSASG